MNTIFTLFLVLHNPVTDMDVTLPYAPYDSLIACRTIEDAVNKADSPMNIEFKIENIEMVETYCDEVMH
jgi:hypothetical protein